MSDFSVFLAVPDTDIAEMDYSVVVGILKDVGDGCMEGNAEQHSYCKNQYDTAVHQ